MLATAGLDCFKSDRLVLTEPAKLRSEACVFGDLVLEGVHIPDLLAFPEPRFVVRGRFGAMCDDDAAVVRAA